MAGRAWVWAAVAFGLWATALGAQAAPQGYRAPRTSFGAPDLQGAWTNMSLTSLERPEGTPLMFATPAEETAYETKTLKAWDAWVAGGVGQGLAEWQPRLPLARMEGRLRTSWLVEPADGQLPWRPDALKRFQATAAIAAQGGASDPEAMSPTDRCLMGGRGSSTPPMMNPAVAGAKLILQTPTEVAILSEMNHDVRIVRIGGRHPPGAVRTWMGDSVGRWEGDTLVVETTNFLPQERFHLLFALSPDARVIERFTRVGPQAILYAFEVDDPATYTRTWRGEMPFVTETGGLGEFACHEGNYAMRDMLAGARQAETAKASGAAP